MIAETKEIDLSRRGMLKITLIWLFAGASLPLLSRFSPLCAAQPLTGGKNILVVYYSRTGHTREVARQICEKARGLIFDIQPVKPYPDDYEAAKKQAMEEQTSGFKPALKTKVRDIRSCDIIFVGTPIWWGGISAPVKSFLSQYDLSGKTIAPFTTHGGSGLGQSLSDIAALCPSSTLLDGLAVWGNKAGSAQSEVADWVRKLRLNK